MNYDVSSKVEQRGVLAGMLLGVGRKDKNNFFIQHSALQEEYLLFKQQLLEQITRKPVRLTRKLTSSGKNLIRLEPKLIPLTRVLVQRLYQKEQKTLTRKFLNYLTPQGIAIWFMDLGSKSWKKKAGKIHALELTLNTNLNQAENEQIIAYFNQVWGWKWGLSRRKQKYRLRMGTQEGKKFIEFLRPYICPSMFYKINTSYNVKITT